MSFQVKATIFFFSLAVFCIPSAVAAFSGSGSGTSGDPYQITTCSELQEMGSGLSSSYVLQNNIDCSATSGWNSGAGFVPVGSVSSQFTGSFNGNSYSITDLFINRSSTDYVGLFGRTNGATIQNVTLTDADITGRQQVGMLVGNLGGGGTVQNILYTGTTTGSYLVGGLIGEISNGTLQYATSTDIRTVSTNGSCCSYAGGIVGYSGTATISNIYASSTVTATNSGRAGGFFGETNGRGGSGVTINRVYGPVLVTSPASGGFIGFAYGSVNAPLTIQDAGVRGKVAGGAGGGFAYTTYSYITFTNVYSAVVLTSSSKGGFQNGVTNTPTITSSFWNSSIAGTANATASGSLAGQDLTATTTAAMQTQSTYTGWNFSTIWGINGGINGGYPYILMTPPDTVAPSVSLTLPSSGAATSSTMILVASASDNRAVAGVKFYIDGVLQGSEDTSAPYSITYDTTATSTGSHSAFAVARDTSNNYATSTVVAFTTNNTPTPASVTASTGSSTATLTWTTPAAASSRVWFGLSSTYSTSTPEVNTSPRVTSHSVSLSGLNSCTRYHYAVTGKTTGTDTATSTNATFDTGGCTGSATISASGSSSITTASGGTLSQGDLTLTVPTSFTATSSSATFQANQIDSTAFFASAGRPSGLSSIGDTVFHLTAFTDATTTLASFSTALTVTLAYEDADVSGYDESSLLIYRYDGSDWYPLSSCSVDTGANTVTCSTTAFSDFAIFGTAVSSSSESSSSGAGALPWCSGPTAPGWNNNLPDGGCGISLGAVAIAVTVESTSPETAVSVEEEVSVPEQDDISAALMFTRTLRSNSQGEDVRLLQKFLNTHGFPLAETGVGSPGNETDYFGPMTWNALVKFQEAYATEVLAPWGLQKGTGILGKTTRAFISNFSN